MKNKYISLLLLCFWSIFTTAQYKEKIKLTEGVKAYENGDYKIAQEHFENSFAENPSYGIAIYNAGNAAYLDGDFDTAREYYNKYINTIETRTERAEALHNIGNSYLKNYKDKQDEKSLLESINYYKNSLRENPSDQETRYNLAYALNQLQQQQKEENKQEKEDKDNKEEKKDKDKDKDKDNKEENQDSQKKENQQKGEEKEEEKKGEMSQKQIEKNLDAVNNDEQKILMKVNRQKGDQKKTKNQVKDW